MVPNVGTKGYHGKELRVPRPSNLRFPTWEPEVTIARNCRFPEVRTYFSRSLATIIAGCDSLKLIVPNLKKHTLPVEGSVDSKKLKHMVLNVALFCLLGG